MGRGDDAAEGEQDEGAAGAVSDRAGGRGAARSAVHNDRETHEEGSTGDARWEVARGKESVLAQAFVDTLDCHWMGKYHKSVRRECMASGRHRDGEDTVSYSFTTRLHGRRRSRKAGHRRLYHQRYYIFYIYLLEINNSMILVRTFFKHDQRWARLIFE